jgi:hypothetical protein
MSRAVTPRTSVNGIRRCLWVPTLSVQVAVNIEQHKSRRPPQRKKGQVSAVVT